MKNLRDELIIENSLIIHNNEPTFFRNQSKSCIDHIFSNCPTKISNTRTHVNNNLSQYNNPKANIINNDNPILSDHAIISCQYNSKDIDIPEQFRIVRNTKLLTARKLQGLVNNNFALNTIFSETDPYKITNVVVTEICNIIKNLAPFKKIQ